ncbi:MAG: RIP metalloprotease RseP [Silanimonas lenta]
MSEFLGSAFWLVVALGLLVTFHEFGHYWVARRCGVKVLRFSVGFGRALWSRVDREGIEWRIGLIPLGGYVSMLDERESAVPAAQKALAFNNRPVGQRIAIVAAGPLANFVLAVGLLYLMFLVGKPDYAPVLAEPEGIAREAGFRAGERILAVGERPTPTWSEAANALIGPMLDREDVPITVRDAEGGTHERWLPLSRLAPGLPEAEAFRAIGLVPRPPVPPAVVGAVDPEGAAAGVLAPGDRILAVDGHPVRDFEDLRRALARHPVEGPAPRLLLHLERRGERIERHLVPRLATLPQGGQVWRLGLSPAAAHDAVLRHGPLAALPAAVKATGQLTGDTVGMLARMLTGAASLDNLSGPITIAQVANTTASRGVAWFLYFLAMLSVSIAILNLLPIPVLDGGHLLYYLIELVQGRPLGDRVLVAGQYLGLILLASLMGLALFNDVLRLVP